MRIKRLIASLFFCLVVFLLIEPIFVQASEKYNGLRYCRIGTAFPGGTSYPVGSAIGNMLDKHMKDIIVISEASNGSRDNVVFLDLKEMELGIVDSPISYQAYYATETFEDDPKNILGLLLLYVQQVQIVVLEDSDIYSIKDLTGKKVAVGPPGSGSENVANNVLRAYKIEDKIQKQHLDLTESTMALQDGTIDAAFYSAMIPVSGIVELVATHNIRILPFEDDMLEKLNKQFGYYIKSIVPAGTYKGVDEDVQLMGFGIEIDVQADLPEDLAYDILTNLFENLAEIRTAHKAIESISLDHAYNTIIPLHPGAAKYYKDKGLID